MKDTLFKFVTIQPLNHHPIIPWVLAFIWLVLVLNCFISIRQQPFSVQARAGWLLAILLIPIVGMTAYLFYCLLYADYAFLKFVMGPPKRPEMSNAPLLRLPANSKRPE
jgi:phospholipase D-like protein